MSDFKLTRTRLCAGCAGVSEAPCMLSKSLGEPESAASAFAQHAHVSARWHENGRGTPGPGPALDPAGGPSESHALARWHRDGHGQRSQLTGGRPEWREGLGLGVGAAGRAPGREPVVRRQPETRTTAGLGPATGLGILWRPAGGLGAPGRERTRRSVRALTRTRTASVPRTVSCLANPRPALSHLPSPSPWRASPEWCSGW